MNGEYKSTRHKSEWWPLLLSIFHVIGIMISIPTDSYACFHDAFFITWFLSIEWYQNENLVDCLPGNLNYRKWTSFLPMPSLPWQEMSLLQNQNWKKNPKCWRNCLKCSIQICLLCVSKLLAFPDMGINMENIRVSTTWKHLFVFKLTTNICVTQVYVLYNERC